MNLPLNTLDTTSLVCRYRVAFGRNLRQVRIDANLSLKDVAAMSGLSESCIRTMEAGQCDPELKTIATLAQVVGRDLWTLLTLPDS